VPVPRPLLGEPLACATNVVRRACVQPDQRIAIVGFGYLAALIVHLLPPNVGGWIAISRRDDSRALARRLGAESAFDYSDVPSTAWDSYPIVIEAAGVQRTLDVATWLTGYGGRLVVAGYHADGARTVNMQSWNWKGIDVINAHERAPAAYARALREGLALVAERRLDLDALVSHRWPLERIHDAFTVLETRPPGFIKGIVEP
jgi:threonine dehydrogenase-like Zn-dependent dehydrogenase